MPFTKGTISARIKLDVYCGHMATQQGSLILKTGAYVRNPGVLKSQV